MLHLQMVTMSCKQNGELGKVLHFASQIGFPFLQNVAHVCTHIWKCCKYFILYLQMVTLTCKQNGELTIVLRLAFQIYPPGLRNVANVCTHIWK